ncbi:MAG: glycosyltransferase family 4 protein [Candidatus Krumholzibacteria bacterium]
MKLVIVSQSYHPRPGGVTENVYHSAEVLRQRGHRVTVVTTHFESRDNGSHPEPDVVRIGRNVLAPVNGAWVNVTVGHGIYGRLKEVLHSLDPDVIHTHCPAAPTLPLMALLAAPARSRVVGTFHAAGRSIMGYHLFKPVIRRLLQRIDRRIAVSNAAMDLASRYFPGMYDVIPNGVDCRRFAPEHLPLDHLRDDAFNVLFVGRMDKRKGLKYLFRAVASLAGRTSRRLRLIVVGDDGPRRHLLPGLPGRVDLVYTGVVSKDELPRYLASGDVLCSPATERESFGIVLLEAMASGIPVIGTGIPGYLTILRDGWNSLVVPARDARSLSESIEKLMNDETLRWKLRSNALDFAQLYRWDRIVDRLEAVYRSEPADEVDLVPASATPFARAQKA